MKKKTVKNKTREYVLIGIFMGLVSAVVLYVLMVNSPSRQSQDISPTSSSSAKIIYNKGETYDSSLLKLNFQFPDNFNLENKDNLLVLTNNKGEILIDRIATNYSTLDGYFKGLEELNHLQITDKTVINTSNQNGVKVMLHGYNDLTKSYFFYPAPWTIFSISTTSPSLYSDLDQIAQSFQYTGKK